MITDHNYINIQYIEHPTADDLYFLSEGAVFSPNSLSVPIT